MFPIVVSAALLALALWFFIKELQKGFRVRIDVKQSPQVAACLICGEGTKTRLDVWDREIPGSMKTYPICPPCVERKGLSNG